MARWKLAVLVVVACLVAAGTGFWFGFREALALGVAAETLPRGLLAMSQLRVLRSGHTDTIVSYLEYEVDKGLVWGPEVLNHPLRKAFVPFWQYDAYPKYERYAVQLADYRKTNPSPTKSEEFKTYLRQLEQEKAKHGELIQNARDYDRRLNAMIERYGSKP